MYSGNNKGDIKQTSVVDLLCEDVPDGLETPTMAPAVRKVLIDGQLYIVVGENMYDLLGRERK